MHHYSIKKQYNGMYQIADGKQFVGPVELIRHHQQHIDGFVTMPTIPCNRMPHQSIVAFRGMSFVELEKELISQAEHLKVNIWLY